MIAVDTERPVELSLDAQLAEAIRRECSVQRVSFVHLPDTVLQSEFSLCLLVGNTIALVAFGVTDGDLWDEINPELKSFFGVNELCRKWVLFAANSVLTKGTLTVSGNQWTLPLDVALMDLVRTTG